MESENKSRKIILELIEIGEKKKELKRQKVELIKQERQLISKLSRNSMRDEGSSVTCDLNKKKITEYFTPEELKAEVEEIFSNEFSKESN
jgi:hypothetical protein